MWEIPGWVPGTDLISGCTTLHVEADQLQFCYNSTMLYTICGIDNFERAHSRVFAIACHCQICYPQKHQFAFVPCYVTCGMSVSQVLNIVTTRYYHQLNLELFFRASWLQQIVFIHLCLWQGSATEPYMFRWFCLFPWNEEIAPPGPRVKFLSFLMYIHLYTAHTHMAWCLSWNKAVPNTKYRVTIYRHLIFAYLWDVSPCPLSSPSLSSSPNLSFTHVLWLSDIQKHLFQNPMLWTLHQSFTCKFVFEQVPFLPHLMQPWMAPGRRSFFFWGGEVAPGWVIPLLLGSFSTNLQSVRSTWLTQFEWQLRGGLFSNKCFLTIFSQQQCHVVTWLKTNTAMCFVFAAFWLAVPPENTCAAKIDGHMCMHAPPFTGMCVPCDLRYCKDCVDRKMLGRFLPRTHAAMFSGITLGDQLVLHL